MNVGRVFPLSTGRARLCCPARKSKTSRLATVPTQAKNSADWVARQVGVCAAKANRVLELGFEEGPLLEVSQTLGARDEVVFLQHGSHLV